MTRRRRQVCQRLLSAESKVMMRIGQRRGSQLLLFTTCDNLSPRLEVLLLLHEFNYMRRRRRRRHGCTSRLVAVIIEAKIDRHRFRASLLPAHTTETNQSGGVVVVQVKLCCSTGRHLCAAPRVVMYVLMCRGRRIRLDWPATIISLRLHCGLPPDKRSAVGSGSGITTTIKRVVAPCTGQPCFRVVWCNH